MSPLTHELHTRRILDMVAERERCSQRSLARELGIALGLANLLVRRLAAKGLIRVVRTRPNQPRYVLTPAGRAHKARLSRADLAASVRSYVTARDRIQQRLTCMMNEANGTRCRTVVFFGAGDDAEVAWVCIQRTSLRLVAVVDDQRAGGMFFGHVIQPSAMLTVERCSDVRYDRIVVLATESREHTSILFARLGIPDSRVFWIGEHVETALQLQ